MDHTDRRVRRTQKLLGDALIALALKKNYNEITIQEITERADIGYRTFFRHYADKDELLQDVLSAIREEMRELMEPPPIEFFTNPGAENAELPDSTLLFQHIQRNRDLYHVFLLSDRTLIHPLKAFAIEEFKENYSTLFETHPPEIPLEIIIDHMISSMITLVRWWLKNDMCYTPAEMGKYATRLIIQPASQLLREGLLE